MLTIRLAFFMQQTVSPERITLAETKVRPIRLSVRTQDFHS